MSAGEKSCRTTPICFRLFSSPEFVVKFTHSTKLSTVAAKRGQRQVAARDQRGCRSAYQATAAGGAPSGCSTLPSRANCSRRHINHETTGMKQLESQSCQTCLTPLIHHSLKMRRLRPEFLRRVNNRAQQASRRAGPMRRSGRFCF